MINIVKWAINFTLYGHDRDIYDFKAQLKSVNLLDYANCLRTRIR